MDQLVWLSFCISLGISLLGNFTAGLPFEDGNNNNVKITRRSLELTQTINIAQTLEDLSELQMDHMIVDREHKLLYCYVPKVRVNPQGRAASQMLARQIKVRGTGMPFFCINALFSSEF